MEWKMQRKTRKKNEKKGKNKRLQKAKLASGWRREGEHWQSSTAINP